MWINKTLIDFNFKLQQSIAQTEGFIKHVGQSTNPPVAQQSKTTALSVEKVVSVQKVQF